MCKFPGCLREVRGRGYCGMHYYRFYRHGDPSFIAPPRGADGPTLFWRKVDKSDSDTACWLWKGYLYNNGYGYVRRGGKSKMAHRYSWEITHGSIPKGLVIDHLCRNHACVNPGHLEVVTEQTNALRGIGVSAINAKKTHCPKGHPYRGDNLTILRNGRRQCRTCNREYCKIRYSIRKYGSEVAAGIEAARIPNGTKLRIKEK